MQDARGQDMGCMRVAVKAKGGLIARTDVQYIKNSHPEGLMGRLGKGAPLCARVSPNPHFF